MTVMISPRTRSSLDQAMLQGLRNGLPLRPDLVLSAEPVDDLEACAATRLVMISVALYRTRLIHLIYFTPDAPTLAHFAEKAGRTPEEFGDQDLLDAIAEAANMACGTLSRELGQVFPQIGMSTPNMLHRASADHLPGLGGGYLQHYRIALTSGLVFFASLCVIEREELDFELKIEAPTDTGELEMF